jgi:hypothetical protein
MRARSRGLAALGAGAGATLEEAKPPEARFTVTDDDGAARLIEVLLAAGVRVIEATPESGRLERPVRRAGKSAAHGPERRSARGTRHEPALIAAFVQQRARSVPRMLLAFSLFTFPLLVLAIARGAGVAQLQTGLWFAVILAPG